ncbi:MAG: radical SAM protein, partial [Myxococcota bacterium]
PVQSGSDSILKRMSRRCSTTEYTDLAAAARAAIPALTITTDVIVGFPGESDSEWAETMAFAEDIGFGHMHIFAYSPRQGTKAAGLSGQVPGPRKRERSRELHHLAATMKRDHLHRFVGDTRAVLWEGQGEPTADGQRRWFGYTDNYLRVETSVPAGCDLENRITPARLDRLVTSANSAGPLDLRLAVTPSAILD